MFTMIFACDMKGAIGKDGDLPWRQSSDLQHFQARDNVENNRHGAKNLGQPCQRPCPAAETL